MFFFYVKVKISELGNKFSFHAFTQIFPPHQQVTLTRVKIDNVLFQENQVGLWEKEEKRSPFVFPPSGLSYYRIIIEL